MAYDYDLIVVGGGLAGSALARSMAAHGARVLVLEREPMFRDRVRGELVQPWGVAEARQLGIYDLLKESCGYEVRLRTNQLYGAPPARPRDLVETTPHRAGSLHFRHPDMQQAVLEAAVRAGATVVRSARVTSIQPGDVPSVVVSKDDREATYRARLVAGADGRSTSCRKWAGFREEHDPDGMVMAGVLLSGLGAPQDVTYAFINPRCNGVAFVIPLGSGRFRCYSAFHKQQGRPRLSGPAAMQDFIEACGAVGVPTAWFAEATMAGPLASFDCAESWVPHPYQRGVVLVGDAAATSDPSFGCGLSLVLRDVRVLSECLVHESNWDAAADAYAEEHDRYFGSLHRLLGWLTQLFYEPGPAAEARRTRAFRRVAEDPARVPDVAGVGPECPSDEAAYLNLFGEA